MNEYLRVDSRQLLGMANVRLMPIHLSVSCVYRISTGSAANGMNLITRIQKARQHEMAYHAGRTRNYNFMRRSRIRHDSLTLSLGAKIIRVFMQGRLMFILA